MRHPKLFDKTLIERNLSFYKKRFNDIAEDRTEWIDSNFHKIEALKYIDIDFRVSELMTIDKITTIREIGSPYPTHIVSNLAWGEEKLDKLLTCLSFRLYKAANSSEVKLLKGLHSFIDVFTSPGHKPRYCVKEPELVNEHVIFSQMNYVLVMCLDDNWAYEKNDLYTFGLDQRKQLKLNPDRAWLATTSKASNAERIMLLMNHLLSKQFTDLRCGMSNDFMAKMIEKFVEINNDPSK